MSSTHLTLYEYEFNPQSVLDATEANLKIVLHYTLPFLSISDMCPCQACGGSINEAQIIKDFATLLI
jgi:hypothetical protein